LLPRLLLLLRLPSLLLSHRPQPQAPHGACFNATFMASLQLQDASTGLPMMAAGAVRSVVPEGDAVGSSMHKHNFTPALAAVEEIATERRQEDGGRYDVCKHTQGSCRSLRTGTHASASPQHHKQTRGRFHLCCTAAAANTVAAPTILPTPGNITHSQHGHDDDDSSEEYVATPRAY
jgi:hypothetical protein